MARAVSLATNQSVPLGLRECEQRQYRLKRGNIPSTVHVLRFGQSVLCNPTGLKDNKLCAVAFTSKVILEAVERVVDHRFFGMPITIDALLDHVDDLQGVHGVFEVKDCFCSLDDRVTHYQVTQFEADGDEAVVSERTVEFDN